jgi:hypothetical protein
MATVTPEQMKKALSSLSALEGMASGYCELQDGFDTSKGIAENVRQVLAALAAPPASDPPRLGCESPSNCDPKLDLCTHCQARTAPNGLTPPSWITARQSDPPGLVANWRPIETAPKRTDVLAGWADRPHWLPQVLQQDDAGMWFSGEESDYRPPTHWMPLPASPQAETKGDES